MGKNRSTLLIAIGAAVFVVGTALAFFAVHGKGDNSPKVQTAATTPAPSAGQVTAPGSAVPSFEIPKGKQALAVSVPYVQGVAGYVKAGDKVNVFGTLKQGSPAPKNLGQTPLAKLLLPDVQVLAVAAPGTAGGGPTTFVLALNPNDAEQLVYFQSFEALYLSLARSDQGIVATPGHTAGAPF
jgi:Flp pilus assembly protein CpaB